MDRKYLDREFYELLIMDMHCLRDKNSVVMVPGFDQAISAGEIMDTGRIVRIVLGFEPLKTQEIAEEFASLASCLSEIGQWYHITGSEFGTKPDKSTLKEPGAMDVWSKYISDYKGFDSTRKGIKGSAPDLLAFMCYRYCKYEAIGAPEMILLNAARELSYAYIINGYSIKAERIDLLMDERDSRSYFPEKKDLDLDEFRRIANYLEDPENITTAKAAEFHQRSESDEDTENLYREYIETRSQDLPYFYMDALQLKYGFGEYDPINEKEIAEDFSDLYKVTITEELVKGILDDALYMIRHEPEPFDEITVNDKFPDGLPGNLKGKDLSWDMISRNIYSYTEEGEMDEYLSETFGDADYVTVPDMESIYYTYSPRWTDIAGLDTVLTNVNVLDYRGMAEFILEKLDKMGVCIVNKFFRHDMIKPSDIYDYSYLDPGLAMKIIRDNPLKLMEKIKASH